MKRHVHGSIAVGMCLVIALLASTAVPSYAQRGGGGWHGGSGGWHGGGGSRNGGWHGGSWNRGWRGGGWGWWGPGVVVGVPLAAPFWGYPYRYPYSYAYAYPYPYGYPAYSPPVVVVSSPQRIYGPPGPPGPAGPPGRQGPVGPAGVQGAPGAAASWTSFKNFLFDFDKSSIRAHDMSEVSNIAAYMRQNPSAKVGIDGHTDPRGSDKYNQALSERRVTAVRDALIKAGVPADRIQTGAFGESQLICNQSTEECWQRDRRVEVLISASQ